MVSELHSALVSSKRQSVTYHRITASVCVLEVSSYLTVESLKLFIVITYIFYDRSA